MTGCKDIEPLSLMRCSKYHRSTGLVASSRTQVEVVEARALLGITYLPFFLLLSTIYIRLQGNDSHA